MTLTMRRMTGAACAVVSAVLLMGAANGAWLHRVSAKDHARMNPLTATPAARAKAVKAGEQIYLNECAKCHGADGDGMYARPRIVSTRVSDASDGDLFWILTNGNPWKGMPAWVSMPPGQRWQVVAYLRSLNLDEPNAGEPNAGEPNAGEPNAGEPNLDKTSTPAKPPVEQTNGASR